MDRTTRRRRKTKNETATQSREPKQNTRRERGEKKGGQKKKKRSGSANAKAFEDQYMSIFYISIHINVYGMHTIERKSIPV